MSASLALRPRAAMAVGQEPAPLAVRPPSAADLVTLASYGLGLWWCLGGPAWAAIASIVGDELDGRIARATGTTSERGSALDWGADVALTPLALARLGRDTGHEIAALALAPAILFVQAEMRSRGARPIIGSARAAIMLATLAFGKKRP